MAFIFPLLLHLALLCWLCNTAMALRLVTYNLRYDSKPDNITVAESISALPDPLQEPVFLATFEEQQWSTRRLRIAQHLTGRNVVLAGFQEALLRQVNDLAELLGDEWAWVWKPSLKLVGDTNAYVKVGVGRDDGVAAGEFNPIFYHKPTVTLLSNETFWLSDTPFEPSKYPDAGSYRLATVTQLTAGGKTFTYINTHLDNASDNQRRLGASLLLIRARYAAVQTNGGAVIVTGDFNSESTGNSSGAYDITTGASPPVSVNSTFADKYAVPGDQLPDFKLLDLRAQVPRRQSVSANYATFTGFSAPNDTKDWTRIDFAFGGSNGGWNVDTYIVDSALADDGVLESDHRPTFVDLTVP